MGNKPPFLSIITPAYNAAAFLPALIDSMAQVAKICDLEWIIVDDGSTDDTASLCEIATKENPNWILIRQKNVGVACARNVGLSAAMGEYVWFVDADDLVVVDAITALLQAAHNKPDIVCFQAERFESNGDKQIRSFIFQLPKPTEPQQGCKWVSLLISQKDWKHYLWQYWYRREHVRNLALQFTPNLIHEDIVFVTEAALQASTVQYAGRVAYRYRNNPISLTNSNMESKLVARIESYFVVVAQLRDLNRRAAMPTLIRAQLQGEVIGQALQVFELAKQIASKKTRQLILAECQRRRFAQQFFPEIRTYKRLRQVIVMYLKQSGFISLDT
jgi:glycosyltransferase involved in cell wall biosynthesis